MSDTQLSMTETREPTLARLAATLTGNRYHGRYAARYNLAHAAMTARLLAVWDAADDRTRRLGAEWYGRAREATEHISRQTYGEVSADGAAGIVAALSPRCRWATNIDWALSMAVSVYDGEPARVSTYRNRERAWYCAIGCDPRDVLGGPKTRAFYANLTGDLGEVTVDMWAASAAIGRPVRAVGIGAYARIAAAYRDVAMYLGIEPAVLQATVWIAVRGSAA